MYALTYNSPILLNKINMILYLKFVLNTLIIILIKYFILNTIGGSIYLGFLKNVAF